jgi:hypothetical protein
MGSVSVGEGGSASNSLTVKIKEGLRLREQERGKEFVRDVAKQVLEAAGVEPSPTEW